MITNFPRQFVLCGTTNEYDYLKDPTGNRRYWPFKSSGVDIDAIKNDREQLWAEAVANYKQGLYIGPTPEEMELAQRAQNKRRSVDSWEDDVTKAVSGLGLLATDGFKTAQVMREMGLMLRDQDQKNTRRIAGILQQNGYVSIVKWNGEKSERIWVRDA